LPRCSVLFGGASQGISPTTSFGTLMKTFVPAIDGDLLYGLGACDMKGAIAAMIVAAARVAGSGLASGRLSLLFTADEDFSELYPD
jgi:acetylornithine deacetylase/succinyl-diaminopimelate desuccinylase-like protein